MYYSYESNEGLNQETNERNIRNNEKFNAEYTTVTEGIVNKSKFLLSAFERYQYIFAEKTIEEQRFIDSSLSCFKKILEQNAQPSRDMNQFIQNVYASTAILEKRWDIMSQLGDNKAKLNELALLTDSLNDVAGYILKMKLHFSSWSHKNTNEDIAKMATLFSGFASGLNKGLNSQLVNDVLKNQPDNAPQILTNIQQDESLMYSSPELDKDRAFVHKEVSNNGLNIQYIPEEFKSDKRLALKAIAQNIHAFNYVDKSLKKDSDFFANAKVVARFSDKINTIQRKATDLAEKGELQAAKTAQTLCANLHHSLDLLISGDIKGSAFQQQCSTAINEARPELEKCSSFKAVLDDILYVVAGVTLFRDSEQMPNKNPGNVVTLFKSVIQNQKSVLTDANELDAYVANSLKASRAGL